MRAAGSALAAYAPLVGWPSELHLDRFAPVGGTWAAVLGAAFVVGAVAVVLSFVLRPTLVRLGFVVLAAALLPASNLVPVYPAIAASWVFAGEQLMYAPLGVLAALAVGALHAGVTVLGARGSGAGRETTRLHPDSARPAPSATAAPMPRSPIAGDDPTALSRRRAKTIPTVATIATAVVAGVFIAAAAPAVRARQHDLGDAERTYRATLERSPSPRACFNLGVALLARGDARGAAEVYEQCALISPNDGAVFVQLGVAHHRAGERNKAEIAYGTALRLTPDDPYAWSNYAALDASAGSYAEARRKWERALEIEPGFAPAVEGLAKLDAIESPRRERVPRPPS
jgi:hypothetical protein